MFNKLHIGSRNIPSSECPNIFRRNSYTVEYKTDNIILKGCVEIFLEVCFCKCKAHSDNEDNVKCARDYYAVIRELTVVDKTFSCDSFGSMTDQIYKVTFSDCIQVISASKILDTLVCVDVDDKKYVIAQPNVYEQD